MATKLSLKLLVDKKTNKVLFAEAGKEFVDFLICLLSLPIASVIKLVHKNNMVGCLGSLYGSVETLNENYILPSQPKDSFLNPRSALAASNFPLLMPRDEATIPKYYKCSSQSYTTFGNGRDCHIYITDGKGVCCPRCHREMSTMLSFVPSSTDSVKSDCVDEKGTTTGEKGFVKGMVTYMVMDDLEVKPLSTISSIALLKFNVDSLSSLEEKVVNFGMEEGLEILKTSLQSNMVLSSVFLWKKLEKKRKRFAKKGLSVMHV